MLHYVARFWFLSFWFHLVLQCVFLIAGWAWVYALSLVASFFRIKNSIEIVCVPEQCTLCHLKIARERTHTADIEWIAFQISDVHNLCTHKNQIKAHLKDHKLNRAAIKRIVFCVMTCLTMYRCLNAANSQCATTWEFSNRNCAHLCAAWERQIRSRNWTFVFPFLVRWIEIKNTHTLNCNWLFAAAQTCNAHFLSNSVEMVCFRFHHSCFYFTFFVSDIGKLTMHLLWCFWNCSIRSQWWSTRWEKITRMCILHKIYLCVCV